MAPQPARMVLAAVALAMTFLAGCTSSPYEASLHLQGTAESIFDVGAAIRVEAHLDLRHVLGNVGPQDAVRIQYGVHSDSAQIFGTNDVEVDLAANDAEAASWRMPPLELELRAEPTPGIQSVRPWVAVYVGEEFQPRTYHREAFYFAGDESKATFMGTRLTYTNLEESAPGPSTYASPAGDAGAPPRHLALSLGENDTYAVTLHNPFPFRVSGHIVMVHRPFADPSAAGEETTSEPAPGRLAVAVAPNATTSWYIERPPNDPRSIEEVRFIFHPKFERQPWQAYV